MNVVAILLAAGSATRFGSDKLLHLLPHGVPMSAQSARHLKSAAEKIFAVVGPKADKLSDLLHSEGCEIVICNNASEGMGSSLACAVRAATGADGYLVALADMPFIRPTSIAAVRDALVGGSALVAPYFRGHRGHPVGISAKFRLELEQLKGDQGAKNLVANHASELIKIPVGDPGVIRDIDTPADLTPPILA